MPALLAKHGYATGIIGKHHIGPLPNYAFEFGMDQSTCWAGALGNKNTDVIPCVPVGGYNNVSRNVTQMKLNGREFFSRVTGRPFFLYVGFGDTHRCEPFQGKLGSFCEFYGTGEFGPTIPDWTPRVYKPSEVVVPPYLPDTPTVRSDLGAMYTSWHRLDTGLGLLLAEVEAAGRANSTLTTFLSDNGLPFPSGKTNLLYQQGSGEPMLLAAPPGWHALGHAAAAARRSSALVSHLDVLPTVLEWAGVAWPAGATAQGQPATPSGSSLLPLLSGAAAEASWRDTAFGSHQFHGIAEYYPMRMLRTRRYTLVHNLGYTSSFGILSDVYGTSTWLDIKAGGERRDNSSGWVGGGHFSR